MRWAVFIAVALLASALKLGESPGGGEGGQLAVLAVFKQEGDVMREWLDHYLGQGVNHFVLIDNGSTDNCKKVLEPYMQSGQVTYVMDLRKWLLPAAYNDYLALLAKYDWVLVVDLDEYVYARKGYQRISEYLETLPTDVGQVSVPWKMFGSSGFIHQPSSVIANFINRHNYVNQDIELKSIVRPRCVAELVIHVHRMIPACRSMCIGSETCSDVPRVSVSEASLSDSPLHINHYNIMSRDRFFAVKATRGDVDDASRENFRNEQYFEANDRYGQGIVDTELKDMKQLLP